MNDPQITISLHNVTEDWLRQNMRYHAASRSFGIGTVTYFLTKGEEAAAIECLRDAANLIEAAQ